MFHKLNTRFALALSLAILLALILASFALADNVMNDLVTGTSSITLTAGDATSYVDVNFYIQPTGGDGDPQCNFDNVESVTEYLTFTINTPNGITAVPNSLTFNKCHDGDDFNAQSVRFSANASAVPGNISFTETKNTSGGSFKYDQADFSIVITSPPPPADVTPPTANPTQSPDANSAGWNNTDVTVTWNWAENQGGSGIDNANCTTSSTSSDEGAAVKLTASCKDLAGNEGTASYTLKIDKTAPTASASTSPASNGNGWNNTDVTVSFSGEDDLSGIDFCSTAVTLSDEGASQSASGTCTDKAGNVSGLATASINIDKTAPTVSLVGGPADGISYYFGFVPAAPTCSASDALSGLDGSCSVSGYSAAVGTHTVTASATDKAGNGAAASASYTVLAWTLNGFYQPVDMNGVTNVVKGGSTVPLKFEVFAGSTELTATSVVKSFIQTKIACDGTAPSDDLEFTTTGGTSLRYDTTAGQFVQNWQTPKLPGQCYRVTMTTQDDSALVAFFRLK